MGQNGSNWAGTRRNSDLKIRSTRRGVQISRAQDAGGRSVIRARQNGHSCELPAAGILKPESSLYERSKEGIARTATADTNFRPHSLAWAKANLHGTHPDRNTRPQRKEIYTVSVSSHLPRQRRSPIVNTGPNSSLYCADIAMTIWDPSSK